MRLTLTLKNVMPEIILRSRSFTGSQSEQNFNADPEVSRIRTATQADPLGYRHLLMQMETLPSEVFEVEINLSVVEKDCEGSWELGHYGNFLHGSRYSPKAKVGMRRFSPNGPQDTSEPTAKLLFKRSAIEFTRDRTGFGYGYPLARRWSISQLCAKGWRRGSDKSISEATPDPQPSTDDRDYPF
jgi:hypothetical protein